MIDAAREFWVQAHPILGAWMDAMVASIVILIVMQIWLIARDLSNQVARMAGSAIRSIHGKR